VKVEKFEDLIVWQRARELVKSVYAFSRKWSDYGLKDQIQRAAVSVMSNIAEGFERGTRDEFLYFLYVARGSCGEVRAQLYVASDQKYISEVDFTRIADEADHVSRLLYNLITSYKKKSYGGQRYGDSSATGRKEFESYLDKLVAEGRKKAAQ
jgi:four helix bundle protein